MMPRHPIDWTAIVVSVTPFLGFVGSIIFIGVMVLR